MNYIDQFRHSRQVNINYPILNSQLNNLNGKYWNCISQPIIAVNDIRARIGSISNPWNAKSSSLMVPPELKYIKNSLADLLDARAVEINNIAQATNKKIAILWSGGIDSTTIVTSFIKNLSTVDLSNITIFLTPSSVSENHAFFRKFILPNFVYKSYYDLDVTNDFLDTHILLHGDPGDCLFGPSIPMYQHLLPDAGHLKPWRDNLQDIIDGIDMRSNRFPNIPKGFGNWYANKISQNLLEVEPDGVDTISDWWWWHYFNFKWEFSIWRPFSFMRTNLFDPISIKNINFYAEYTFMNTAEFQLWSYTNLKTHVGRDLQNHKIQAKQYIFELDSNSTYFDYKTKVDSMPKFWSKDLRPMFYDDHWIGHYLTEPGVKETAIELLENFKG